MTSFDEDWDDEVNTSGGDMFSKVDFTPAGAVAPHVPEVVRPEKNKYTPTAGALQLERDDTQEKLERKQAIQLKSSYSGRKPGSAINKAPSFGSHKGAPVVRTEPEPVARVKFDDEVVDFFDRVNKESFTKQAIEYLNAYWDEIGDQAEWIYSVAMKVFREADMHRQGVQLIYMYEEGCDVDYSTYLYFYEKLVKYVNNNPKWANGQYEKSAVYEVKTALKHKNELREKVDVNFDGRISFLEFLLYQYSTVSNPNNFYQRVNEQSEVHPAILKAQAALADINEKVRDYEQERARLEKGAAQSGVKGLTFKHQLTMLDKGVIFEKLNHSLIDAEAAVRIAVKKFAGKLGLTGAAAKDVPRGSLWWMQRDLEEKKKVTIPNTLRRIKKKGRK